MKILPRFLFPLPAAALALLSGCIDPALNTPPPQGGDYPPGGAPYGGREMQRDWRDGRDGYRDGRDRDDFGPRSYQKGYQFGMQDGRAGRSENYARYRGEFNVRYESSFRQGYHAGYVAGRRDRPDYGRSDGPSDAWRTGFALGQRDRRLRLPPDIDRHHGEFNRYTRDNFARGYREGYY